MWLHKGKWGNSSGGGGANGSEPLEVFTDEFWEKATTAPRGGRRYHWAKTGDVYRAIGVGDQVS